MSSSSDPHKQTKRDSKNNERVTNAMKTPKRNNLNYKLD